MEHGGKGMEQGAWSMGGRHDATVVDSFVEDGKPETGDRRPEEGERRDGWMVQGMLWSRAEEAA
ncbi:MAG: hypothetical protein LWW85_05160 [Marinilabiliales bacterium]|nr:hypothetical protein [Marinilabiliales bacterium]